MSMGRPIGHEGRIHWIPTRDGTSGDFVSDEELDAVSDWISSYDEELQIHKQKLDRKVRDDVRTSHENYT